MHQALLIHEIISNVLVLTSRGTIASATRVCRAWNPPASSLLWRHMYDLLPLLRLIGPMEKRLKQPVRSANRSDSDSEDSDYLGPRAWYYVDQERRWTNFGRVASRVKKLLYNEYGHPPLSEDVMLSVALGRSDLLPKLVELIWIPYESTAALNFCLPFISPSLTRLYVILPPDQILFVSTWPNVSSFLEELGHRCPQLVDFALAVIPDRDWPAVQTSLVDLLTTLTRLRTLKLSSQLFSAPIVDAIRVLPELEALESIGRFDAHRFTWLDDLPSDQERAIHVQPDDFRNLKTLSVRMSTAPRLLHVTSQYDLRRLFLQSLDRLQQDPDPRFQPIPGMCPKLNCIEIEYASTESPRTVMQWDSFRPLLELKHIRKFRFLAPFPLQLTQDNIKELAQGWPDMEYLSIGWRYSGFGQGGSGRLPLSALGILATYCSKLRHLGVMHCTDVPQLGIAPPQFAQLETLDVGLSPQPDNPGGIARFLLGMCTRPLRIIQNVSDYERADSHAIFCDGDLSGITLQQATGAWRTVEVVLRELCMARFESAARDSKAQSRIRELQDQVRSLRGMQS